MCISLNKYECVYINCKVSKHSCEWIWMDFEWMNEWMNGWMNEWMDEWCIYKALYCVLLYTQSALQSCGGGVSPQPAPVCSIHLDDATAATVQRCQCAHHTPATGGEEREIEPIKWVGIIMRPWLIRASGGNLARTPGLHPYSLQEVPWDF